MLVLYMGEFMVSTININNDIKEPTRGCQNRNTTRIQWSGRTGSLLQMNRLSLRNNRLNFKTVGKLPVILEEFIEYTPISIKENRRMSTCNLLDLQTLGSQPIMPKKLSDHCSYINSLVRIPRQENLCRPSYYLGQYYHSWSYWCWDGFTRIWRFLHNIYLDLNDVEQKKILKYPYRIGNKKMWKRHYRYPNGIKKDDTSQTLVQTMTL